MSATSGTGNIVFVVLLPTAHRVTIRASPNTSILQILEDACKKSGLDAVEWDLKHYNRVLELSNSVRFSGLPNNATLEMVQSSKPRNRKESNIKLGLQLESGKRLLGEFLPSQTLWEILSHWNEKGESVFVVASEVSEVDDILPVCVYMRHEIIGPNNLKSMTLRSLGLTQGSAIIRLLHRSEKQLKHQANVSSSLSRTTVKVDEVGGGEIKGSMVTVDTTVETSDSKEIEQLEAKEKLDVEMSAPEDKPVNLASNKDPSPEPNVTKISAGNVVLPSSAHSGDKNGAGGSVSETRANNSTAANATTSNTETPMELDPEVYSATPSITNAQRYSKAGDFFLIGKTDAVIYHSDDVLIQVKDNIPDDFFNVTLSDVDSMYRDLKSKREALEESPLLTAAKRALQKDQSILSSIRDHPTTIVRIRFPNRYVLQGTFRTLETIGAVYEFVRSFLEKSDLDFHLFTAPPKKVLNTEIRLVEEGLVGLAVVYFGSDVAGEMPLKPDVYGKLSDPNIIFEKLRLAQRTGSESTSDPTTDTPTEPTFQQPGSSSSASSDTQSGSTSHEPPRQRQPNTRNNTASGKVPKWFKK